MFIIHVYTKCSNHSFTCFLFGVEALFILIKSLALSKTTKDFLDRIFLKMKMDIYAPNIHLRKTHFCLEFCATWDSNTKEREIQHYTKTTLKKIYWIRLISRHNTRYGNIEDCFKTFVGEIEGSSSQLLFI